MFLLQYSAHFAFSCVSLKVLKVTVATHHIEGVMSHRVIYVNQITHFVFTKTMTEVCFCCNGL